MKTATRLRAHTSGVGAVRILRRALSYGCTRFSSEHRTFALAALAQGTFRLTVAASSVRTRTNHAARSYVFIKRRFIVSSLECSTKTLRRPDLRIAKSNTKSSTAVMSTGDGIIDSNGMIGTEELPLPKPTIVERAISARLRVPVFGTGKKTEQILEKSSTLTSKQIAAATACSRQPEVQQ